MQPLRRLIVLLEGRQEVVPEDELPQLGPIRPEDVEIALKNTRPSAHLHAHRYKKLNADYGSEILQWIIIKGKGGISSKITVLHPLIWSMYLKCFFLNFTCLLTYSEELLVS